MISVSKINLFDLIRFRILFEMESYSIKPKIAGNAILGTKQKIQEYEYL